MKKVILLTSIIMFSATSWAKTGAQVYTQACQMCHAAGIAGAPKTGDKKAWKARLDKGTSALLTSIKKGKGAMPPGAMCPTCSDTEYKAAIKYMSKK